MFNIICSIINTIHSRYDIKQTGRGKKHEVQNTCNDKELSDLTK